MPKYQFTPAMGEISGFGGGNEEACRRMLKAGLEWCDSHPKASPKFQTFKGLFGIITPENDDARALLRAMIHAAGMDGATGAMCQAVVRTIFFIRKNGWDKYVEEMSKREGL